jgi:hypothetical protein
MRYADTGAPEVSKKTLLTPELAEGTVCAITTQERVERRAEVRSPILITCGIALVFLAGCASETATPAASSTSAAPTAATERVVIRPVVPSGLPAAGYAVTDDKTVTLDCGTTPSNTQASPVAVDDNILSCSPSSAYAVACWKDPAPFVVVCYRDPWNKKLVRMPIGESFPAVTAPSPAQPLGLLLSDGDHCLIRNGGTWNGLAQHPGWYGTYSCARDGAVWDDNADGINQSSPRWTVNVAPISGAGPLNTRGVIKAYFIGTE